MKNTDIEMAEEMKEIGRDFPSYFGTGKAVLPKKHGNLTLLKGFNHYFAEVDQEERLTQPISKEKIPEPVKVFKKRPDELTPFSSVFKSKKEQEEFLAQFKEDVSPAEQEPDSMAESNSENKPPDDVSKISVIETSMTGAEIEAQTISIHTSKEAVTETELSPKLEPEFKPELEPTPELVPESEYEANPELGLETACEVLSGRNIEDNLSGPDPMDVLAETACKAKMISEAHVAAASGLNLEFVEPAPQETDHSAERVNSWGLPDFDLLEPIPPRTIIQDTETTRQLEKVLLDFGVKAKII
jgi:S-DNA-T family DNA segregation ATPase FtsK/SpoIIIE